MKCPKCGSEVRPSKKYPGFYLCDTCRKRYPESAVIGTDEESADSRPEARRTGSADSRPEARRTGSADPHTEARRTGSADSRTEARRTGSAGSRAETRSSRPAASSGRRRRKKRKSRLPIILGSLLVLILIGAIAAYASGLIGSKDKSSKKPETPAAGADKDAKQEETKYKVGDTAELDGIRFQVLDYEESTGDEWATPKEGNKFLFVNMEIMNNTEEDLTVSSMASFESYCEGYKLDYSSNAFTALATNTDKQQMDGSIAPGKSLNGYLCLEVPAGWTSVEVQYSSNVWSEQKITFEISR